MIKLAAAVRLLALSWQHLLVCFEKLVHFRGIKTKPLLEGQEFRWKKCLLQINVTRLQLKATN